MLVIMAVALLALAGLVVDGGAKLDEAENATAVAQEAARAGAGMVNQGKAYSTGAFTVDPSRAVAAAQAYLASVASAGYQGSVIAGPGSIQVTVTVTQPTKILSIIGIDSMTVTRISHRRPGDRRDRTRTMTGRGRRLAVALRGTAALVILLALVIGLPLALTGSAAIRSRDICPAGTRSAAICCTATTARSSWRGPRRQLAGVGGLHAGRGHRGSGRAARP